MLEQLIAFFTASVVLTLMPGPDIIYVLVRSISSGKRSGVMTAAGLASGVLVHTSLVAFGVALLVKEIPSVFYVIKLLGAFYLCYLAFQAYKSDPELSFSSGTLSAKKSWQLYRKGFLLNVSNPKVIIFFLAFFPGFLWQPHENIVLQFYCLGVLFMLQAFAIFSIVAMLSGRIAEKFRNNRRAATWFKWIQVTAFVGLAWMILLA